MDPLKRKKVYKMMIDEEDEDGGVFAISLVADPAIEQNFVFMSKQKDIVQLAQVSADKRILMGPVLIPNKLIPRMDEETGEEYDIVFTPEIIEKAAQLFMQRQHNNSATLEHMAGIDDLSVVESWIVEDPRKDKQSVYNMFYPRGTWMVKMKVNNPEIWKDYVKTGKVKGFSIEGLFGHERVAAKRMDDVQLMLGSIQNEADTEFSEELLAAMKAMIVRDGRVKTGKYIEMETYNDYPDGVTNNAKKGIEYNAKQGNKCATPVGKIRAQQLAQRKNISVQTIKRMYAYTSRAQAFYDPSDTSACGTISYLLWGGDAARRWSASKLKDLGLFEASGKDLDYNSSVRGNTKEESYKNPIRMETSVGVTSSYAGQFGGKKNITLVSCSATKLGEKAMAKDFYQGALFKKSLAYALKISEIDDIYIISAKYGLVKLEQELEPYDVSLKDYNPEQKQAFALKIYMALKSKYKKLEDKVVTILAGKAYYDELIKIVPVYDLPLEGLRIGESMADLDEKLSLALSMLDEDVRMEVILDYYLEKVSCPEATQNIELNLKNRQVAIDQANYGPLNPNEPNEDYWLAKANQFGGDVESAKKALCGNCAFFDVRKQTLSCIETGIGTEDDPELVIEAGQLGYCEAFDFKCASSRTCDAWVVGGPIK
jgi:hypothetical protein